MYYFPLSVCISLSFLYITFNHKLTLALIWISKIEKNKLKWPGHFIVWQYSLYLQFQCCYFFLVYSKCNHLGSLMDHNVPVSTIDWCQYEFFFVLVCVYFRRASINSTFFLVYLFIFVTHQIKRTTKLDCDKIINKSNKHNSS